MNAALASMSLRTVSGKTPPTAFLVTLWAMALFFTGATVAMLVAGLRLHRQARAAGPLRPGDAPPTDADGRPINVAGKAGCLLTAAVPCGLLAVFLISWVVGVS